MAENDMRMLEERLYNARGVLRDLDREIIRLRTRAPKKITTHELAEVLEAWGYAVLRTLDGEHKEV